jgi:hypothetical protein
MAEKKFTTEDLSVGARNVTFKVPHKKRPHRRAKSDPHIPYSASRLLSEEIAQLQRKKFALEQGKDVIGWDRKEKKKLQGAIELVLEEKRKEQLTTLKRRSRRLERRLSLNDIKSSKIEIEPKVPPARPFVRSRSHRQNRSLSVHDKQNSINTWGSADLFSSKTAKSELPHASVEAKAETFPERLPKTNRYMTISAAEFKHLLRDYPTGPPTIFESKPSPTFESKPPPLRTLNKKRTSWEKLFSLQKNKVSKSKSPRETSGCSVVPEKRSGRTSPTSPPSSSAATSPHASCMYASAPGGTAGVGAAAFVKAEYVSGKVSPRLQERCQFLDRWLRARPTWVELFDTKKGKPKVKAKPIPHLVSVKAQEESEGAKKKETFRASTDALEQLLNARPSWTEVMDKGIAKDEKRGQKKKEKTKNKILNLLRKRKEKEEKESVGVDVYYELGHKGDTTVSACHTVTATEAEEDATASSYREINFFHLDFIGRIGGGCYGNVYEAFLKGEKNKVAVKILKNDLIAPEKAYKREVEALKRTYKSPYTVNLRGYCTDPYYCIVTELCEGGSLDSLLHTKGQRLTLEQAVRVARLVAEGLRYLHSLKPPILHRDISLGNIFLQPSVDGRVCIGDFGIAVEKTKRGSIRFSKNGNPRYRAPEVSKGEPYSRKADVYSYGNLFYELLTNLRPFHEVEDNKVAEVITRGELPRFPDDCDVPEKLKSLIQDCWKADPQDRPSFKKILARLDKFSEEYENDKKKITGLSFAWPSMGTNGGVGAIPALRVSAQRTNDN